MSHFAEIDQNGIVKRVIVAEQDFIDSGKLGNPKNWVQTSYNTRCGKRYLPNSNNIEDKSRPPFRGNYAMIGGKYDAALDAFIGPQPYKSWLLNKETFQWEAPVKVVGDPNSFVWNEEKIDWVKIN